MRLAARRPVGALVVLFCLVAPIPLVPVSARAQGLAVVDRPLSTDTAHVLDSGEAVVGAGAEHVRLPDHGRLTSAPVLTTRIGISGLGELSAAYRWLWRHDPRGPDANGTGDLFLFGKLRLLDGLDDAGRPSRVPALAVRLGVKLPNASATERLGTNNTDFSMLALLTQHVGRAELRLSGGLQILESPFDALAQTDAWTFGAALLLHVPGGFTPFVEYYTQIANAEHFDYTEGRAGVRWGRGRLGLDVSASVGFTGDRRLGYAGELSRDWGVAAGATWRFDLPGYGRTWGRQSGAAVPPEWR